MSGLTLIQWADRTLNPQVGCTRVSDGCSRCYIDTTMPFRVGKIGFDGPGIGASTPIRQYPERMLRPFSWQQPQRVFLNSLTDMYHQAASDEFLAWVFAGMSLAHWHTFLTLTKRHARQRALLNSPAFVELVAEQRARMLAENPKTCDQLRRRGEGRQLVWPLPNLHVGVSAEAERPGWERLSALTRTPAALRWVSAEPLLGPLDLAPWLRMDRGPRWVVVGGESAKKRGHARRMDPAWMEAIIAQGAQARVPVFVKQLGSALADEWGLKHDKGGDPAEWPQRWPLQLPEGAV